MPYKHSFEKRWNYLDGMYSCYTDDAAEVAAAIKRGNVKFVQDGHADIYDYSDGTTEYARVAVRSLTPEQFMAEHVTD